MIKICIDTGNAAFEDSAPREIARILRDLIEFDGIAEVVYCFQANEKRKLMDHNGNSCGFIQLKAGHSADES